jgi:hypothetical protein
MDVDKSLYMKEFLEMRSTLGTVINKPATDLFQINLYNEFLPRKVKEEVKQVVKEIEEKTIQILDKGQLKNKQNKNETEEIKVISDKKDEVS